MAERMSFEEFWKKTFPHCQPIKGYGLAKTAWHHQQLTIDAQAKQIAELEAKVKELEHEQ